MSESTAVPRCRVCGCTEAEGCPPESCSWVEADLCSACQELLQKVQETRPYQLAGKLSRKVLLRGATLAIRAYRDRLVQYAHGE